MLTLLLLIVMICVSMCDQLPDSDYSHLRGSPFDGSGDRTTNTERYNNGPH